MTKFKLLLDSALFHTDMNGKLIPHSVNAGPQLECRTCRNLRCGKDFTMTRNGQTVQINECIYCATK